jgi:DNA-binding protein H-NS
MARTSVEIQLAKLRKQRDALDAKEKALRAKSNDKVIAEIVALAKKHNVSLTELTSAFGKGTRKAAGKVKLMRVAAKTTDKRAKVAPKYRNPSDATQTWTGRGKSPIWVQALKNAGTLDTALIRAI